MEMLKMYATVGNQTAWKNIVSATGKAENVGISANALAARTMRRNRSFKDWKVKKK